jgi:ubiquitin-protein ligase
MWWVKDPDRLKREVEGVARLQEREAWLLTATPRMLKGLKFAYDFDLNLSGETFPFTLAYPAFFPETPPSIFPRDGRRLSDHQYGDGGELCLEFRSDNWDPSVSGAMMIESAYCLLSGERPTSDARAMVPSVHRTSVGQQLRGWYCRFLLTDKFFAYAAALPVGTYRDATVIEIAQLKDTWVAYVAAVGPSDGPDWRETDIPDRGDKGEKAVLVRVASLADLPQMPDHASLEQLILGARRSETATPGETAVPRFTIVTDAQSARTFYTYSKDGAWNVIPYRTLDLADDAGERLPQGYAALAQKKVGVVGCGSLGSKIAASLARTGVGEFVLVDDDVVTPGNLKRHELDAGGLGAHKTDALKARLEAIASVGVSVWRVALGGQESSSGTAAVLDELGTCDLLIDATADPQAFNFVASVATNARRPMVWAETYAGGIGGFVARVRPDKEPPPHAARRQYLAWCREQGVPWRGDDREYGARTGSERPLIADDADVTVIAAYASRMAIDLLVRPEVSAFPHPAYAIGLSNEWIFGEPFDTRPVDFVAEGEWQSPASPERTVEALEFLSSLFEEVEDADRTGT